MLIGEKVQFCQKRYAKNNIRKRVNSNFPWLSLTLSSLRTAGSRDGDEKQEPLLGAKWVEQPEKMLKKIRWNFWEN